MIEQKKVFVDTDCLSAFLICGGRNILLEMFDEVILPGQVYEEFQRLGSSRRGLKPRVDALKKSGRVKIHKIDALDECAKRYMQIRDGDENHKAIGKGEAAAITLAEYYKGILASNNMRDIEAYINELGIEHMTSSMIIKEAVLQKKLEEEEAEIIWREMLKFGIKLPVKTFAEFCEKYK